MKPFLLLVLMLAAAFGVLELVSLLNRNVRAVFLKERKTYFVSGIGYVVMFIFMTLAGYFFLDSAIRWWPQGEGNLRGLYHSINIVFVFIIPLLTMRTFAEEKATGTMELLMTSPVREVELVVGKYLAACFLYFSLLVLTLQYPAFLIGYGNPDPGPLYTGYLGLILVGMAFIALGLFTSSLTANQIVAAVLGFVILLLLYVLYWPTQYKAGTFAKVIQYICVYSRVNWESDLSKGILDTRDLVFFASFIFIFLFLSVRSLASSRWR